MKVRLRAKNDKFTFECREGESLLYAGLRNGLTLPYECATGTCGTCKARVREPSTVQDTWAEAPGNSYLKRERGEFLMCQTHVRADCEIAVPAVIEAETPAVTPPKWIKGTLVEPRQLTHDVISFSIETDAAMNFAAGQFVIVETPDVPGFRAYSMVNYAQGTQQLEFVVKKKPDGAFSEWLFAADRAGTALQVFGPLGRATFDPGEACDVICIAGGSGVAGMMSILAHGCECGHFAERRGQLFFGVRTMQDAFFLDELAGLVAQYPETLEVVIALSDEDAPKGDQVPCDGRLRFATGFVHQVAADIIGAPREDAVAFVAGPPPMVDGALRMLIMTVRLPADSIRYDKFS